MIIMKKTGRSRGRGFTLIEVLVALAIFSIIIAALYGTFFLSHKAMGAVDDKLVRLQECRAVLDVIKREIESAYYSSEKKYTAFKLDDRDFYGRQASQLLFTAFSPLMPGLSKITYTIEEDKGRLVLMKKVVSANSRSDEARPMEMIEDIGSFTIEARFNNKWVRTWDSALSFAIPDEIRVSVAILIKDGAKPDSADASVSLSDIARPRIGRTI